MPHFNSSALPSDDAPYAFGFDLLEKADAAGFALNDSGVVGLFELVGAIIAEGGATQPFIENEVVRVGGEWYRPLVSHVLELGHRVCLAEWIKHPDGTYSV